MPLNWPTSYWKKSAPVTAGAAFDKCIRGFYCWLNGNHDLASASTTHIKAEDITTANSSLNIPETSEGYPKCECITFQ